LTRLYYNPYPRSKVKGFPKKTGGPAFQPAGMNQWALQIPAGGDAYPLRGEPCKGPCDLSHGVFRLDGPFRPQKDSDLPGWGFG